MISIKKQLGLSLVELMISIALGLMLMVGVVQMFVSGKDAFKSQQGMSRIQETGRLAVEFISKDVRAASYYGCARPDPNNPLKKLQNSTLNLGGLHTNFDVGIMGYDGPTNLPNYVSNSAATDLGIATVSDNNILVIRGTSDVGLTVNQVNTATQLYVYTSETAVTNGCVNSLCQNQALVVSDCFASRVFQASALSVGANKLTISHADTWNPSLPHQNFKYGEVAPLRTVAYFIANGTSGFPSLFQRVNTDTATELLEGVERMRITYAVRPTTASPTPTYRLASAITAAEWPLIASVRVELVIRSLENFVVAEPQPYSYGGGAVTPTDRYLRQVFTTTIAIRSR